MDNRPKLYITGGLAGGRFIRFSRGTSRGTVHSLERAERKPESHFGVHTKNRGGFYKTALKSVGSFDWYYLDSFERMNRPLAVEQIGLMSLG